jgi:chlorobactene glucosyltransferase
VVFLSLLPALRDVTFWEKVIQPVVGLFVFLTQPLWRARAPCSGVVVANGQFLLVERETYAGVGGHGSVKGAIVEDVELARVYKMRGLPLLLAPAFDDVEVRMYRGLSGIWRGWGKTFHPYVAASPLGLWVGVLALLAIFFAPFVVLPIALSQDRTWLVQGEAIAVALIVGNAILFRRASRHELAHGVFWPLAIVVLFALVVSRTAAVVRGTGVTWKGRRVG